MENGYTCCACHMAFSTNEIQREHYKTDWHRYNLKRQVGPLLLRQYSLIGLRKDEMMQVAEMAPISLADFETRVAAHAPAGKKVTSLFC